MTDEEQVPEEAAQKTRRVRMVKGTFTVMGEPKKPDASFIVTDGRVDDFIGLIVLWCVRLTWFRHTRLTGQALARILSVPFMLLAVTNGCVTYGIPFHPNWFGMAFQIGWISFMIHQVHTNSRRLEPLNSTSPPLMVAVYAVRMKISRIMWLGALLLVAPLSFLPGGFSLLFITGELIVLLAIEYSNIIGRPWPPAKKQRVPLRVRIPQILPRLTPGRVGA